MQSRDNELSEEDRRNGAINARHLFFIQMDLQLKELRLLRQFIGVTHPDIALVDDAIKVRLAELEQRAQY